MNLTQHTDYEKYLSDHEIMRSVQTELTTWFDLNGGKEAAWITAVAQLSTLYQEYNQIMWQAFPFCHMCLGGCCVAGASEVTQMDAAALIALGHDLPILPAQTNHNERACIYLGQQGCTWPTNWRPLKCMTFYSLGSGDWQLESSDRRYEHLSQALQIVLKTHLPHILDEAHPINIDELAEPIEFAAFLAQQVAEQFLPASFSHDSQQATLLAQPIDAVAIALLAIANITAKILLELPVRTDELLADLEEFEWTITGHPARECEILAEINGRYTAHIHEHPTYLQFTQDIQQYQQSTIKNTEDS